MGDYSGSLDTLYWSPSEIAQLATDLANWGKEVENSIKSAYNIVNELGVSRSWSGKLFNDLADTMNAQRGFFIEAITRLSEEIPSNMNESARTDANASGASFASYTPVSVAQDYEVALTPDDGTGILTFNESVVTEANANFTNAFSTAQENLIKYKENFNSLFNEALSARAQAYSKYEYIVESTVSTCVEIFQNFCDTFLQKARSSEEVIKLADTMAANQANNINTGALG